MFLITIIPSKRYLSLLQLFQDERFVLQLHVTSANEGLDLGGPRCSLLTPASITSWLTILNNT